MQYFLPMRRTSLQEARASAGRAVRRLADLRLGSRSPSRPPVIGRLWYATATAVAQWWAATTRRVRLSWLGFRSLSNLEQGCWAFLAAVSSVCLTLRMLRPWGF
jgi:hypothetical protein